MFFTKKSKLEKKHPLIYAILVGTGVILFWRGLWGLLDTMLLPTYPFLSYVVSIIIGILILGVTRHLTKELQ